MRRPILKRRKKPNPNSNPTSVLNNPKYKKNKKPKYTAQEIKSFQQTALELYKADEGHAKELGRALLKVRKAMKHGQFKPWWEKHNLSQARVSYCIRLAQGKVAAAKLTVSYSPARKAMSQIKQHVDDFLKFCLNPKHSQTLDQIDNELASVFLRTIGGIALMRDFPAFNESDPQIQTAVANFKCALSELLDATFQPATLDRMRVGSAIPKKEPQSEYAVAVAAR